MGRDRHKDYWDTYRRKRELKRRAAEKRKEEKEKKKDLANEGLCVGPDGDIGTNAESGKKYGAETWNEMDHVKRQECVDTGVEWWLTIATVEMHGYAEARRQVWTRMDET